MFTRILSHVQRIHPALRKSDQVYMVLLAILIGLLAGLGAVGFRELIRLVKDVAWHDGQYTLDYLRACRGGGRCSRRASAGYSSG